MEEYSKLNFPSITLRALRREEGVSVWDAVRQRYVVLTPEEWVRQHVVAWLMESYGLLPVQIVLEYPVEIGGTHQRADVVVVDKSGKPLLVVECKEVNVDFTREEVLHQVYGQAVRYNATLHAPQIMITNGLRHFCFRTEDYCSYTPTRELKF